jgi:hypothetical protein
MLHFSGNGVDANDQTYLKGAPFYNALIRWDEKAGLQRDAIRSQGSTRSKRKRKEDGYDED